MLNIILLSFFLRFPAQIESHLDSVGFFISPTAARNIYDIYEQTRKANEPVLITSDLILHTSHLLYDYSLRIAELFSLRPKLDSLTTGLLSASLSRYKKTKDEKIIPALIDNIAFFGTAAKLLELELPELPEEAMDKINAEIKLINEHTGIKESEIFGYNEDYTQYVPRGHYTRNYQFEQYFKAMMWYGRIGFYIKPDPSMYPFDVDPVQEGIKLTRRAILITKTVNSFPQLKRLWKEIYEPTISFVGKSDDFTIEDYYKLILKTKNLNLSKDTTILLFIAKANKLPAPKIISVVTEDTTGGLKGFRLMGQRFIPDAYAFQNLVYPKVGKYKGSKHPFTAESTAVGVLRCFPRGLDIMALFGNPSAREILAKNEDNKYENYDTQFAKFRNYFNEIPTSEWKSTLYFHWLYILKSLADNKNLNCPKFMNSDNWKLKELNTALAGWTELKHDAILYSKQSYTFLTTSMPRKPNFIQGWVEPYPGIYREFSEFMTELSTITSYPSEVKTKITNYADILAQLSRISSKELAGQPLTHQEYKLIWNIGSTLKEFTFFSDELMTKITSGTDDEMALVADVHTDPNSKQVLEEAVGYANVVYVRVSDDLTARGGVMSYCEFKAPMDERYTDEKWQNELRNKELKFENWFSPLILEY